MLVTSVVVGDCVTVVTVIGSNVVVVVAGLSVLEVVVVVVVELVVVVNVELVVLLESVEEVVDVPVELPPHPAIASAANNSDGINLKTTRRPVPRSPPPLSL